MANILALIKSAAQKLQAVTHCPKLEAEILLSTALVVNRHQFYYHTELAIEQRQLQHFFDLVDERLTGKPIAYLTNHKEFYGLDFYVNENVLIPRADTELLVDIILKDEREAIKVLDLGTGSGAIAVAIAHAKSKWLVYGLDISMQALKIANINCNHARARVNLVCGDWLDAIAKEKFDIIVSNPPYLANHDPHLTTDIRYEPMQALVAGTTGLEQIKTLAALAFDKLAKNGMLIIEHGCDHGADVLHILSAAGYHNLTTHYDISGLARATSGFLWI